MFAEEPVSIWNVTEAVSGTRAWYFHQYYQCRKLPQRREHLQSQTLLLWHLTAKWPTLPQLLHFCPIAGYNVLSSTCLPPKNRHSLDLLLDDGVRVELLRGFPFSCDFDLCLTVNIFLSWYFACNFQWSRMSNLTCFDCFNYFIQIEFTLSEFP